MMDTPLQPSLPFLAFPREIRDMIYKHIVVTDGPVKLSFTVDDDGNARLYRVCKQVHEEATAVFYKDNTFFIPKAFFLCGKPLQRVPTAALYRLRASRLGMMTKMDVQIPVAYSGSKSRDRKVLAKLKTFVKILAAHARPQLQLRFFCGVRLDRGMDCLVEEFCSRANAGVPVASIDMQPLRDAATIGGFGCLQLMPSALRIITRYSGSVQSHVCVVVHPALLRQAKAALTSFDIPSYLLHSRLDSPRVLWDTIPDVLRIFGAPQASATTVRVMKDGAYFECLLDCLKPENAWMWRFFPMTGCLLSNMRKDVGGIDEQE